jgi:hypothetical protein
MAYTITTTAGATLASIADGTVNSTATSLTLIGKNYAGYGIFLNENYVKLLENFASGTAPSAPLTGQLWYNTGSNTLEIWNNSLGIWKAISSSISQASAPSGGVSVTGDLWWDTSNAQLKVYSGSAWITIGPSYTSTAGTSGAVVETILDSSSGSHVVVKFYISNTVIAILSKDSQFTPQTSIPGFTLIKPGLNLISSSTITGAQFSGDTSSATTLNGLSASQFLRSDQNASTAYQITAGGGLIVGSDLNITTTSNTEVILNSTTSNKSLNLYVNKGGVQTLGVGIFGSNGAVALGGALLTSGATTIGGAFTATSTTTLQGVTTLNANMLPGADNTREIGSTSFKFANVWATTFRGTAITAQYADLAERFETDAPLLPGTVVELGGSKEITAVIHDLSDAVFGVISTAAGFLMNGIAGNDNTHPPVAMSGRVPVRVIGKVKKGDRLVSAGAGLARSATRSEISPFNVIGRALEDKNTTDEQLIEAVVKINS